MEFLDYEGLKLYNENIQSLIEQNVQSTSNNLEIGGRNLLTNSELKHNITGYSASRGTLTLVDGECTRFTTNSDNNYHILYLTNSVTTTIARITECDNLIFSFMMRCSNTTDTMYIQFACKDANGTIKYLTTPDFNAKDSEWNKVEISPSGNMREWIKNNNLISTVSLYFVSTAENATIELYNLKLEQGNKATAWTPAPEDVDAAINSKLSLSGGLMTGPIAFPTATQGDRVLLKDGDNGYNLLTYTLLGLSVARNLYPAASNYNLGDSSIPWGNAYLNNLLSVSSINSNDMQPLLINGYDIHITSENNGVTISGGLELYGETVSNSAIYAPAFYETSDIRKKDIKSDIPLSKCYELIDKCQTIIYSLKDQTQELVGMIAQEIEEFFPEVVATDKDGFKSLAYDRLVVICFKVLKDVIKRLEILENAE